MLTLTLRMQKVHNSESESVKSDMRAAIETKVKLMIEDWTTTSGFLVAMVTVIEGNYTL